MFRLTREIRFAVNHGMDEPADGAVANGYGGHPPLAGLGYFFTLAATIQGPLDPDSSYLLNIRKIDQRLRSLAVPVVVRHVRQGTFAGGGGVMQELLAVVRDAWRPVRLVSLRLQLSPFQAWEIRSEETPMVRLSQKFEFAATHRLHNPALDDATNRALFGKCNNPHGHGHNYEVQVTVTGTPDENGIIVPIRQLEQLVDATVIQRLDHKNLNVEVEEFCELIPSVENIARVIFGLLKEKLTWPHARLAAVTVWETPKTWCEYTETASPANDG